ncbi:MAG: LLM class flavin-dependent oxidoreductase [Alphaproteobacteria bacterium]|nr:LLM class flavin-dependent oxidoreductase [Alphaproteobacteria bacterium]
MKIVFTSGIRNLPGKPLPLVQLYRDHLEEAVLAEELGFDNVWVSEHHFSPDQWNPSPFTFLAAVAARTSHIRLGTYVLLLPLRNPVQVAEDVAVLDNISNGRIDLAVGVGSAAGEFRTLGIPVNERLGRTFEALTVIERCFTGEEFSHRGKYFDFPNLRMTTTTVQQPGPPIWVASMGPQSTRWTARRGYHMAAGGGPGHAPYEQQLREFGHDPATRQIASVPIRLHLAATQEAAWDEAEAGLHQVLHFYRSRSNPEAGSSAAGPLKELPRLGEFRHVRGIGHGGTPFMVGTPDDVLRMLEQFRDKRLTHLSLNFHQPGQDSAAVRRSVQLFAKELLPAIKQW